MFRGAIGLALPVLLTVGANASCGGQSAPEYANRTPGMWAIAFPATGGSSVLAVTAVGPDIVAVGSFSGKLRTPTGLVSSRGDRDVFVARVGPTGSYTVSIFGGPGADEATAVAVLGARIGIVGHTEGLPEYGITTGGYFAILDPKGESKVVAVTATDYAAPRSICADSDHFYISGSFSGALTYGDATVRAEGSQDGFVAAFEPNGIPVWAARFGNANSDAVLASTPAIDGGVVITGSYTGELALSSFQLQSIGKQSDVFVARLDRDGYISWAQSIGGPNEDRVSAVVTTADGYAVAGNFRAEISLGNTRAKAHGGRDGFVARLDVRGRGTALSNIGGDDDERLVGAAAHHGEVVVVGSSGGLERWFAAPAGNGRGEDLARGRVSVAATSAAGARLVIGGSHQGRVFGLKPRKVRTAFVAATAVRIAAPVAVK